jgi:hypothetical protein
VRQPLPLCLGQVGEELRSPVKVLCHLHIIDDAT